MNAQELKLFSLLDKEPVLSRLTCNSCENRQRWECNSKVFQYCRIRKSNRTANGLLKIKCKTVACASYKPLTTNDWAWGMFAVFRQIDLSLVLSAFVSFFFLKSI